MTIGGRIAHKRKELGLSQEALGEKLGVSRQAIYKWESDATLPEIEKLVALSRMFSVSVGWLLGVEEETQTRDRTSGDESVQSEDLTTEQMKMVEEIVSRYLSAQPKPPKRKKWPFLLAAVAMILAFASLFSRLDRLDSRYNSLQNSIHNVTNSVNRDISSITNRVEEVLKSQNFLTASYSTQFKEADLAANTITFTVRAVPRTYTDGMGVIFAAQSGEALVEVEGTEGSGLEFTADITCELTDEIILTAIFVTGDKRETQQLEIYTYLYSESFPVVSTMWPLWFDVVRGKDELEPSDDCVDYFEGGKSFGEGQQAEAVSVRVGLFKDRKLIMWHEETWRDVTMNGVPTKEKIYYRPAVELERGHVYTEAVVVTDQFGRERVYCDTPIHYVEGEGWCQVNSYSNSNDPADWEY